MPSPGHPPPRRDTRLEAAGAEFLVLGSLLAEGIPAWKAYTNFPGYDIVAGDLDRGRLCRIQVKSRFVTGAPGFPIGNFDCDVVCFVRLNRGSRRYLAAERAATTKTSALLPAGRQPPEIYVLPRQVVQEAWTPGAPFGKGGVTLRSITEPERYLHAWDIVRNELAASARAGRAR